MPYIPDFKPVQGNKADAVPSRGAMLAAGNAMQQVGNAISSVADDASAYQMKLTEARDAGVMSNASLSMQQAYQEHQEFRMKNPDESLWEEDINARVSKAKESIFEQKMSPFAKAKLETQMKTWESDSLHNTRMDSLKQARARSRQAITNTAEAYIQAGDFESARQTLESGRGTVYHPEETDADLNKLAADQKDFDKRQAYNADLATIEQDPFSARETYQSPTPPDGADPVEYARKRDHWRSTLAREQNGILDSIKDGIASGKIVSADQLDEYQDELGAATVATLKTGMARIGDETRKLEVSKPENQAAIIGEVSSAIDALDPKNIEDRVKIEQALDEIQPGPTKNVLSGELTKKLAGEPPSPGAARRVRAMLNDAYTRGFFGPVAISTPQETSDAISDGFLQDAAKLQSLGLSQEQIDKIQNPELKPAQQLQQFRILWGSRDQTKAKAADPYTLSAASAIVTARNKIPTPPEQLQQETRKAWDALRKKGQIEKDLHEWQQDHPDGDVEKEFFRRLGDQESTTFLDTLGGGDWFAEDNAATLTNPELPAGMGSAGDTILPPK